MSQVTDAWEKSLLNLISQTDLQIVFLGRHSEIKKDNKVLINSNFETCIGFLKGYIEKTKEIECEHATGTGKRFID